MSSTLVGVVGPAGSGKSSSIFPEPKLDIIGLDSKTTFIINISGKPFPTKGWRNAYTLFAGKEGNYLNSQDPNVICQAMQFVSKSRPEITNVVLDDFQYLMAFELIEKALRKDWDKWNEIAMHCMQVLNTGRSLRDNIKTFVLAHSEDVEVGFEVQKKIKTVGKLVDSAIELPGLFTVLLFTKNTWDDSNKVMNYEFVTNRDGQFPAKSPFGMFNERYIRNDLGLVASTIDEYENSSK